MSHSTRQVVASFLLCVGLFYYFPAGGKESKIANPAPKLEETPTKDESKALEAPEDFPETSAAEVGVRAINTYNGCRKYFSRSFNTRENIARKSACGTYFYAIASTLLLLKESEIISNVCIPKDVTTEDVLSAFLRWAENHPDAMDTVSAKATILALQEKYPCGEVKALEEAKTPEKVKTP